MKHARHISACLSGIRINPGHLISSANPAKEHQQFAYLDNGNFKCKNVGFVSFSCFIKCLIEILYIVFNKKYDLQNQELCDT